MNVFFPRRKVKSAGPGVKSLETPRLHIGWNEDDIPLWTEFPYTGKDGKLAYRGGAVLVIADEPGEIRIEIIKAHTGKGNRKVGKVRVTDDTHTTQVIIENPVESYSPRTFDRWGRPRYG